MLQTQVQHCDPLSDLGNVEKTGYNSYTATAATAAATAAAWSHCDLDSTLSSVTKSITAQVMSRAQEQSEIKAP